MAMRPDLTGKKFGRWLVIKHDPHPDRRTSRAHDFWECRCDCGIIRRVSGWHLRAGASKSCRCGIKQHGEDNNQRRKARLRHGQNYFDRSSPWYGQVAQALRRCRTQGIATDFSSIHEFIAHLNEIVPERCPILGVRFERIMGRQSSPCTPTIDRKDNSKGYTRDNIQVISWRANTMKSNASAAELRIFAEWVLREMPEPTKRFEAGVSAGLLH